MLEELRTTNHEPRTRFYDPRDFRQKNRDDAGISGGRTGGSRHGDAARHVGAWRTCRAAEPRTRCRRRGKTQAHLMIRRRNLGMPAAHREPSKSEKRDSGEGKAQDLHAADNKRARCINTRELSKVVVWLGREGQQ